MDEGLFKVVGKGILEGISFSKNVPYEEAQRIKSALQGGGFDDLTVIKSKASVGLSKISEEFILERERAEEKMLREMC